MKLMDLECMSCGHVYEEFIPNDAVIGSAQTCHCDNCGHSLGKVLPCAPDLRTPMNSASFLDGHRDGQDAWNHRIRYMEAQNKWKRAKQGQTTLSDSEAGAVCQDVIEMGRKAT